MKLVIALVLCFATATWQQYVYWPQPQWYPFHHDRNEVNPAVNNLLRSGLPLRYRQPINYPQQPIALNDDQPIDERANYFDFEQNLSPRILGLLSYKLISNALYSRTVTETEFSTSVSVVTANRIVTCYTSGMFAQTTACRRRRDLTIDHSPVSSSLDESPTPHESELDAVTIDQLRQGKHIAYDAIESSKYESTDPLVARFVRPERQLFSNFFSTVTVTSVVTSFSLSSSVSTFSNTNFAGDLALACVPAGFTICP